MILITNEPIQSDSTRVAALQFRADTFTESLYISLGPPLQAPWPRTFADERDAFRAMLPMLNARFPALYVAISGGKVVESGPSRREVTRLFFQHYQRGPVYIGFVGPQRIIRQGSPFRSRPDASLP